MPSLVGSEMCIRDSAWVVVVERLGFWMRVAKSLGFGVSIEIDLFFVILT